MHEHDLITYPTWEKYLVVSNVISNLSIKNRRQIFQLTRSSVSCTPDLFFPEFGFTLSEFAVWYTLGDYRRKNRKRQNVAADLAD